MKFVVRYLCIRIIIVINNKRVISDDIEEIPKNTYANNTNIYSVFYLSLFNNGKTILDFAVFRFVNRQI
jgi:hypothetical protein